MSEYDKQNLRKLKTKRHPDAGHLISDPKQPILIDRQTAPKPDTIIGIQSVALTFQVLEEMAAAGGPIGVSELARRLGEAKARIHRHLITLRDLGILVQDRRSERYRLGWKLFELGHAAGAQFDIKDVARPYLVKLRDATGLAAGLTLPLGDEAIVTEVVESESQIAVNIRKGMHMPLYSSNVGRIIIAFAPDETQRRTIPRAIKQLAAKEPGNSEGFRQLLQRIRARYYDTSYDPQVSGVCALAAPVLDDEERIIAVIGVVGTQTQIPDPPPLTMIRHVHDCAAGISASTGSNVYEKLGLGAAATSLAAG